MNIFEAPESKWEKGKPSGSIACMGKQKPRFDWSCLSVIMKNASPPENNAFLIVIIETFLTKE